MTRVYDAAQGARFLSELAKDLGDGFIELRAFASGRGSAATQKWIRRPGEEVEWVKAQIRMQKNVYVGVAARKREGGKKEDCLHSRFMFAEIDAKDHGGNLEDCYSRQEDAPFRPGMIIESGGGLQNYYPLDAPFGLETAEDRTCFDEWLKALVPALGADPASAECARVLRLPGTWNFKPEYGQPRPVRFSERETDPALRSIVQFPHPTPKGRPTSNAQRPEDAGPGENLPTPEELIRRAHVEARAEGSRNKGAVWLSAQLRDNEYSEADAEGIVCRYAAEAPAKDAPFTQEEALKTLHNVYANPRPGRRPWAQPSGYAELPTPGSTKRASQSDEPAAAVEDLPPITEITDENQWRHWFGQAWQRKRDHETADKLVIGHLYTMQVTDLPHGKKTEWIKQYLHDPEGYILPQIQNWASIAKAYPELTERAWRGENLWQNGDRPKTWDGLRVLAPRDEVVRKEYLQKRMSVPQMQRELREKGFMRPKPSQEPKGWRACEAAGLPTKVANILAEETRKDGKNVVMAKVETIFGRRKPGQEYEYFEDPERERLSAENRYLKAQLAATQHDLAELHRQFDDLKKERSPLLIHSDTPAAANFTGAVKNENEHRQTPLPASASSDPTPSSANFTAPVKNQKEGPIPPFQQAAERGPEVVKSNFTAPVKNENMPPPEIEKPSLLAPKSNFTAPVKNGSDPKTAEDWQDGTEPDRRQLARNICPDLLDAIDRNTIPAVPYAARYRNGDHFEGLNLRLKARMVVDDFITLEEFGEAEAAERMEMTERVWLEIAVQSVPVHPELPPEREPPVPRLQFATEKDVQQDPDPLARYAPLFASGPIEYGILYVSIADRFGVDLVDVPVEIAGLEKSGRIRKTPLRAGLDCYEWTGGGLPA